MKIALALAPCALTPGTTLRYLGDAVGASARRARPVSGASRSMPTRRARGVYGRVPQ